MCVPAAIATVLGITPQGDTPLITTVAAALAGKRLLLVIDNCEHLLRAAGSVIESYGALAAACAVPGTYRLLHRWRTGWHEWCIVRRRRRSLVRMTRGDGCRLRMWSGSDEGHEEFKGAGQGQGRARR